MKVSESGYTKDELLDIVDKYQIGRASCRERV